MYVYSLLNPKPVDNNNVVLCKIKKNPRVVKKRRISEHVNATYSNALQDSKKQMIVLPNENHSPMNNMNTDSTESKIKIDDAVWNEAYNYLPSVPEIRDIEVSNEAYSYLSLVPEIKDSKDTILPGFDRDGLFHILDPDVTIVPKFASDSYFYSNEVIFDT